MTAAVEGEEVGRGLESMSAYTDNRTAAFFINCWLETGCWRTMDMWQRPTNVCRNEKPRHSQDTRGRCQLDGNRYKRRLSGWEEGSGSRWRGEGGCVRTTTHRERCETKRERGGDCGGGVEATVWSPLMTTLWQCAEPWLTPACVPVLLRDHLIKLYTWHEPAFVMSTAFTAFCLSPPKKMYSKLCICVKYCRFVFAPFQEKPCSCVIEVGVN